MPQVSRRQGLLAMFMAAAACGPKSAGDGPDTAGSSADATTGSTSTMTPTSSSGAAPTGTDPSATTTTITPTGSTSDTSDTSGMTGMTGTTGTTGGPPAPVSCGPKIYDCGNGEDDDGDGKIDLADPECTSPCDDNEGSWQTSLPSGDADCVQDCYWDANWGVGDDTCLLKVACDPLGPGMQIGCPFDPNKACGETNGASVTPECLDRCLPATPNGCDCFGCCHVATGDATIDIYLGSSKECRLDNLAGCLPCTFHDECDNPCEPEDCELCFGSTELPPGCAAPGCAGTNPCTVDEWGISSCAAGMYCVTGCCAPLVL